MTKPPLKHKYFSKQIFPILKQNSDFKTFSSFFVVLLISSSNSFFKNTIFVWTILKVLTNVNYFFKSFPNKAVRIFRN